MVVELLRRFFRGRRPVVALLVLLLASLLLMSYATRNSDRFSELYSVLVLVNVLGLLVLVGLVARNLTHLARQYRTRQPGSRLTTRLLLTFVLLSVAPVAVVYYFSLQFLNQGIDSWFDVRIERALEDALELGRLALDAPKRDALNRTELAAQRLGGVSLEMEAVALDDLRLGSGAQEATLFEAGGEIVASSSTDPLAFVPDLPAEGVMSQLRASGSYVGLESSGEEELLVRVVVPVHGAVSERYLQALYPVSGRLNELAGEVQQAYGDYEELAYLRKPLKYSFTITLSLVSMLSLLGAVWAAFFSASRLAAPVRDLAEGTRAVAQGDYDTKLPSAGGDEIGFLVESFNSMTRRLRKARDETHESQQQLAAQHAYLEAVLGRLSSGVVTFTRDLRLHTANAAAGHVLGIDTGSLKGSPLREIVGASAPLAPFADVVRERFGHNGDDWSEMVTLFGESGRRVLMMRGTVLAGDPGGFVVVFDDLTALIQAQRNAAWGEVARRLAHEIKNPLTPIQLSAERMRHKLLKGMAPAEAEVLERATRTIVQQVEAMKEMVNAFSDYARAPQMRLAPVDLNELVVEVLELYRGGGVEPRSRLAERLPPLEGDAGRLRQLLHNLVKNAQEAVAGGVGGELVVATRCAEEAGCRAVELTVEDNGPGFSEELGDQLFEPYVTTKPKGSGLGLAIVKKIVEEHGGMIRAENLEPRGARIIIRLPAPVAAGGEVETLESA